MANVHFEPLFALNQAVPQNRIPIQIVTFQYFSRLPLEIRLIIWKQACRVTRNLDLWPFLVRSAIDQSDGRTQVDYRTHTGIPSILHTCREAREEGLRWYTLAFGSPHRTAFHNYIFSGVSEIRVPDRIYVNWDYDTIVIMLTRVSARLLACLQTSLWTHQAIQRIAAPPEMALILTLVNMNQLRGILIYEWDVLEERMYTPSHPVEIGFHSLEDAVTALQLLGQRELYDNRLARGQVMNNLFSAKWFLTEDFAEAEKDIPVVEIALMSIASVEKHDGEDWANADDGKQLEDGEAGADWQGQEEVVDEEDEEDEDDGEFQISYQGPFS